MNYKYISYLIFALFITACGGGSGGDNNGTPPPTTTTNKTLSFTLNGSKIKGLTIDSNDIKAKTSEVTIGVSNTITTLKIGTLEIAKINTEELKNIITISDSSKNSVVELLDYLSLEGLVNDDAKDVLLVIIEATKNSVASINENAWNSIYTNGELDLGSSLFTSVSSELKTLMDGSTVDKVSVITSMNSRIIEKTADYVVEKGLEPSSTKDKIKEKLKKSIRWSDYVSSSFSSDDSYESINSKINSVNLARISNVYEKTVVFLAPQPADRDTTRRDYMVDLYVGTEPFYINHPDERYSNYLSKKTENLYHPSLTMVSVTDLNPNTVYYFNMVLKYFNKAGEYVISDAKVQGYAKTFPEKLNFKFSEHIKMDGRPRTEGVEEISFSQGIPDKITLDFGYYIEPSKLPKECEQKPSYKYDCSFFKERVAYTTGATFRGYSSSDPITITATKLTINSTQAVAICGNILNQDSEVDAATLETAESGIIFLKNHYKRDAAYSSEYDYPYGRDAYYAFHPKHFYVFKEDATKYPYGESKDKLIVKSGYPKLVNGCIDGGSRGSALSNLFAIDPQPIVDYAVADLRIQQSDYTENCAVLDTPLTVQALKCPAFTAYRLQRPGTAQSRSANYTTIRDYSHLPKKVEISIVGEGQVFLNLPSESATKIFEVNEDTGSTQVFTLNGAFNSQQWDGAYFSLKTTDFGTTNTWDSAGSCVFKDEDYNKCYFDFNGPVFKANAIFYEDKEGVAKGICDNAIVLKNEYRRDISYDITDGYSIEDERLSVPTGWYAFYEEINAEHGVASDGYVKMYQGTCPTMLKGPALYGISISATSTLPSRIFEQTDIDLSARTFVNLVSVCVDIKTILNREVDPGFQAKALQCADKTVYFLARPLKDKMAHVTDRSK